MTAVNWLEEELAKNLKNIVMNQDYKLMEYLFDEARKMEKQQIIDAYNQWVVVKNKAEQYYNETYGSKKRYDEMSDKEIEDWGIENN